MTRFSTSTRRMRGRTATTTSSATSVTSSCAVPLGARPQRLDDVAHDRRDGTSPSPTTARPVSSSLRKSTSSTSSAIASTSCRACSSSASRVGARQRGAVEQREQPGERRSQLVGHRCGEADSKLLERIGRRRLSHDLQYGQGADRRRRRDRRPGDGRPHRRRRATSRSGRRRASRGSPRSATRRLTSSSST